MKRLAATLQRPPRLFHSFKLQRCAGNGASSPAVLPSGYDDQTREAYMRKYRALQNEVAGAPRQFQVQSAGFMLADPRFLSINSQISVWLVYFVHGRVCKPGTTRNSRSKSNRTFRLIRYATVDFSSPMQLHFTCTKCTGRVKKYLLGKKNRPTSTQTSVCDHCIVCY
jgi:hypothetical protein